MTYALLAGVFLLAFANAANGVGVQRREQTNWALVRQILLAWIVTVPLGLACGLGFYHLLKVLG